jgi:hypothetical protein
MVAAGAAACSDSDPAAPAFPQEAALDVVAQSKPAEATFGITVTADDDPCVGDATGLNFTCPANVEMILLTVEVLGASGPVDRGAIVFYWCQGEGVGSESSCATGDTKWTKYGRLDVGEDGTTGIGWITRAGFTFSPHTLTWKYFGQGSGLRNTEGPVVTIIQTGSGS